MKVLRGQQVVVPHILKALKEAMQFEVNVFFHAHLPNLDMKSNHGEMIESHSL